MDPGFWRSGNFKSQVEAVRVGGEAKSHFRAPDPGLVTNVIDFGDFGVSLEAQNSSKTFFKSAYPYLQDLGFLIS